YCKISPSWLRNVNPRGTVRVGFAHPLSPGRVMLAVELQPALLPRGRWNSILAPGDVIAALIERRQVIEPFELKSLINCQTDEDAPPILVDKISPGRVVPRISHAVRLRLRSKDPSEHLRAAGIRMPRQ